MKKEGKYRNLFSILLKVRAEKYDAVVNLQRFASTGIFTAFSNARQKVGFSKNPFSFLFTHRIRHVLGGGTHEVDRNQQLVEHIASGKSMKPRLYPTADQFDKVAKYKTSRYVCLAPASVWFTKQLPKEQWIKLVHKLAPGIRIYLLGAPSDKDLCDSIIQESGHRDIINLCGQMDLLTSAALMRDAVMNYVNDSAPLHLASAVDAPVTAFFCSTVPSFGFGPLSTISNIAEIQEPLDCRPCNLHGKKECPLGHFNCAQKINVEQWAV